MLPKKRRLSAVEVHEVIARGTSSRASALSLKYLPGASPLRAAVVISKKVAKQAVERNRLRRAVYRALAGFKGHGSAVVFVQKIPLAPVAPAFREELVVLLEKQK